MTVKHIMAAALVLVTMAGCGTMAGINPENTPKSGFGALSAMSGIGAVKDGLTIPKGEGRATTFWNGNYTYKGKRDTGNMSKGAWGDANKPTDYFCALPVGFTGAAAKWHNQKILVTAPSTGKQVVVPVQDSGPAPSTGNAIDLSPVAKEALGIDFMENLYVKFEFAPTDAPVGPVQ